MKQTRIFLVLACTAMLFSCGENKTASKTGSEDVESTVTNNDAPKTINPNSTDFTSGPLAKYIEVVDEPAEITYVYKDDYEQHIRVAVPLKMVKDGFEGVDYRDIDFTQLLSVALIKLVDANGEEIQELGIDDTVPLKKLLTKKEGETATIIFDERFANPTGSKEWYEKAVSFTPYMTANIIVSSVE